MSTAAEAIFKQIKALSVQDQRELAELMHELDPQELSRWPDFAGRMQAIFGHRRIEGDPQKFWDEERGL